MTTLSVVVLALLMLALVPGSARATCASSVASGPSNFTDPTATPGDAELGAPDIGTVNNALDATCRLRVEVLLAPLALQANQYLTVQFDLDESTNDPATELVDVVVYVYPDGSAWLEDVVPLPTFGQYGFTITLDQLGVTRSPSLLGVAVEAALDPDGFSDSGDETYDFAPDLNLAMHRVPISFSQPQPPPPPPPPPAAAPPPPPATTQAKGCKVPKIKGLTVKKAKAALKKAGCKYKLKGKGRVRSVSPKAGTRTSATVKIKARQKKRKRSARRSGLARVAQLR